MVINESNDCDITQAQPVPEIWHILVVLPQHLLSDSIQSIHFKRNLTIPELLHIPESQMEGDDSQSLRERVCVCEREREGEV